MEWTAWFRNNHRPVFYIAWILVNLVQAGTTGLFDDEAYYWVYSRYLDWGYFDHPPVIALMIRAGYNLFANELGVRLLVVLASTATVFAIDSLLEKRNDRLFYAIAISMALLQIGGIMAAPDLPLIFFIALFFLAYRSFTRNASFANAVLLGVIAALMLYSKYHGVLVIAFTLMSNGKLLLKWQTWLAGIMALALFAPHLYWQYSHDFPSVRYHLFERNATDYQFGFTLEYVLGQVLLAGPLVGWLMLWAAARHRPQSDVERAMRWTFLGIYLLFFVSTFKGRSEANWTVPAWVSMIVLAHQYLDGRPDLAKWIYRLMMPSFLLVLMVRIYMMVDIAPLPFLKKDEFHKNREWADAIKAKAGGLPVVFTNSYQRASQYWFYSGDTAFSLNNIWYRRSNFNFWPLEARTLVKPAAVFSGDDYSFFRDTVWNSRRLIGMARVDSFYSYSQVALVKGEKIIARRQANASVAPRKVKASLDLMVPDALRVAPGFNTFDTAAVFLVVYLHDNDPAMIIPTGAQLRDGLAGTMQLDFWIPDSIPPGNYRARWAIRNSIPDRPSINSSASRLIVE